ncbi:MAG: winged helix-turn-helix transcriptional regulator [Abditibacteriota bacterium]|nr:winged helix-turn-helix transcriptional regulator [Abditibacteriota bacterium]
MTKQEKVINFIKKQIEEGKYKPGKRILSEEDLAYYLKVSRITVRGALNVLEKENIVERLPRSGTYVKGNSRKHIIISTNEIFLLSEISSFQKQIINLLNIKIEENGFIPFLHMEKSKKKDRYGFTEDIDISNTLHVPLEEIAGLISLNGNQDAYNSFKENNIPIILISDTYGNKYPTIIHDNEFYYSTINNLITKNNFKDVVFLRYEVHDFIIELESLIHYAMNNYYKNNYYLIDIPISIKKSDIINKIDTELKKIKKAPDCVVFLDNTLYINTLPLLSKYSKIFEKTKIITQSNNDEVYPAGYKICRLAYKPEDFVEKGSEVLFKLIKGVYPIQVSHNIRCEIIDEEALLGDL